jgi:hypothetical protein
LPERFRRVFALEPTVMNCSASRGPQATLSDERKAVLQRALRRRAEFDDAVAAFERLRAAPAFARWSEVALWMYVRHGFETLQDGRVRLRCTPQIEAAMLEPIFEAMEQIYSGDARGNPFSWLSEIQCPVRISTAETSAPIYKQMAALALELVPAASQWHFSKVGHCVAQEAHALLLDALAVFDADPRS